jgi:hypothetical protein
MYGQAMRGEVLPSHILITAVEVGKAHVTLTELHARIDHRRWQKVEVLVAEPPLATEADFITPLQ